jgi:hypothetical protein
MTHYDYIHTRSLDQILLIYLKSYIYSSNGSELKKMSNLQYDELYILMKKDLICDIKEDPSGGYLFLFESKQIVHIDNIFRMQSLLNVIGSKQGRLHVNRIVLDGWADKHVKSVLSGLRSLA